MKMFVASFLTIGCSLIFAAGVLSADEMGKDQASPDQSQPGEFSQQIMSVDELMDLKVQTQEGKEIGSIKEVVLDAKEGKIAYAVVGSGTFMGIFSEDEQIIVPWEALNYQQEQQEVVMIINATEQQLRDAPKGDMEQLSDRQQGQQIHDYYGLSPYWEEGQSPLQEVPEEPVQVMPEEPIQ